jgi:hypothetical protein
MAVYARWAAGFSSPVKRIERETPSLATTTS